ncbi:MAG: hypothetical protein AB8G05_22980 [Oligoflexales bacterium]
MLHLIKYKFFNIIIFLLAYLLCNDTCLGDGVPFSHDNIQQRDKVKRISTKDDKGLEKHTHNEFSYEKPDEDLSYNIFGILGSSSFNGETSLVKSNHIGVKLSADFHEQSIEAYQQGTAQSFNSGISDYASSQSTFNYANTLFQMVIIDCGISFIRSNSTINSQITVFNAGIEYFQGNDWNLGTRLYSGQYSVSIAKDVHTTQLSPFLAKNTYLARLGYNIKFKLAANISQVNTTYNNEVFFSSEKLRFFSYHNELHLYNKSNHLMLSYWSGEEYVTMHDRGYLIRSLYNHYSQGISFEFGYNLTADAKIIIGVARELFFEREDQHKAMEKTGKIAASLSF